MVGPATFNGDWTIEVVQKQSDAEHHFGVVGADAAFAWWDGVLGAGPFPVSGAHWTIRVESKRPGVSWYPCKLARLATEYTATDGLFALVGADNDYLDEADGDYRDLVLRCRSTAPETAPWLPLVRKLDFSVPKKVWENRKKHPKHHLELDLELDPKDHHPKKPGQ